MKQETQSRIIEFYILPLLQNAIFVPVFFCSYIKGESYLQSDCMCSIKKNNVSKDKAEGTRVLENSSRLQYYTIENEKDFTVDTYKHLRKVFIKKYRI